MCRREAGALGGKLLGAGGGGFMLLFVPPEKQDKVRETLHNLINVPFSFDHNGSQIIYYQHEEDYSTVAMDRDVRSVAPFRELNQIARG